MEWENKAQTLEKIFAKDISDIRLPFRIQKECQNSVMRKPSTQLKINIGPDISVI